MTPAGPPIAPGDLGPPKGSEEAAKQTVRRPCGVFVARTPVGARKSRNRPPPLPADASALAFFALRH